MVRSLLLGALVLVLGGVLVFLLGSSEDRRGAELGDAGRRGVEPAVPSAGGADALARPVARPDDGAPPAEAADVGDAPEPTGPGSRAAAAPEAGSGGVRLTVVRADTGAPVPGARVRHLASAAAPDRERFLDLQQIDGLMRERGSELAAGPDGVVWLPEAPRDFLFVVASAPGLFGKSVLQAGSTEPRELELSRDGPLAVRVLESDGAPAVGAEVAIASLQRRRWRDLLTTRTDEEGRARFAHAGAAMDQREEADGWRVAVVAPTLAPVAAELDPGALPGGEVELRLPPSGRVLVTVLEVDGTPFAGEGSVDLGYVGEGESRQRSAFAGGDRTRATRELSSGSARFDWVTLDQELELRVERAGAAVPTVHFADGPTRAREAVRVEVRLGSDHPVVRLRAVDEAGEPLAGRDLGFGLERRSKHLVDEDRGTVTTDAEGSFLLDVDPHWLPDTHRTLRVTLGPLQAPERLASLDLSRDLEPGLHDLGTLTLAEPPVFVAGEVVDPSGEGVAGATLRLERERPSGQGWAEVWDFRHRTEDDGAFRVAGGVDGERFRLSIHEAGWAATPVPFAPGDRVRIEAVRAGELPGSLRVDDGVPLERLQLTIEPAEDGAPADFLSWRDARRRPDGKGRFRFVRLLPGRYVVRVNLDGDPDPLLEVRDVFVRGGGETVEPRLQDIDLRGRLAVHRLTLTGAAEGEALTGRLQLRPAGVESARWEWRHFRGDDVEIVARHPAIDVVVGVDGYRSERIDGLRGAAVVELVRGLPVRLVLVGDAQVPEPPICLKAVLLDESAHGAIDWGASCFDAAREVRTEVQGAGRMRVQWVLERRSSGSAVALTPAAATPQYVQVVDGAAEQVIEVRLSQAQLDDFLRSLGG